MLKTLAAFLVLTFLTGISLGVKFTHDILPKSIYLKNFLV